MAVQLEKLDPVRQLRGEIEGAIGNKTNSQAAARMIERRIGIGRTDRRMRTKMQAEEGIIMEIRSHMMINTRTPIREEDLNELQTEGDNRKTTSNNSNSKSLKKVLPPLLQIPL